MSVPHDRMSHPSPVRSGTHWNVIDWVAMILMVVGSLNWGLVGALNLDLVARFFGEMTNASRIVYGLVGLAGIYGLVVLVKMAKTPKET